MAAQATAAAKLPHAAKHPSKPPTSCPNPVQPGIEPYGPTDFHQIINNVAVLPADQALRYDYMVYAGALRANPQQGLMIVVTIDKDPCADGAASTPIEYYNSPFQRGALTITRMAGETVAFTAADGSTGAFDYATGQFH